MSDSSIMAGTWIVTYGKYKYTYTFDKSGAVRWRDFWDKTQTGVGRWSKSGNNITFSWTGSTTKEAWVLDDDGVNALGDVHASYGNFDDLVATKSTSASDANQLMAQWADCYKMKVPFSSPHICHFAVPYPALAGPKQGVVWLDKENMGGPIQKIRGLAIHTTAGNESRTAYETAMWGCVGTWNARRQSGGVKAVSAHFAVAVDGKLIQIVPINLIAWAQGGIADNYYLSVEVENNGENPMQVIQLDSVKRLFTWVVKTFNVPRQLGTGLIGTAAFKQYDPITKAVCESAGVETTRDPAVSAAASGLSCHQWLHPKKCPGPGILSQMASIVKPGAVS
jgi:hypothetical protein